jgi:hypothetical protein
MDFVGKDWTANNLPKFEDSKLDSYSINRSSHKEIIPLLLSLNKNGVCVDEQ